MSKEEEYEDRGDVFVSEGEDADDDEDEELDPIDEDEDEESDDEDDSEDEDDESDDEDEDDSDEDEDEDDESDDEDEDDSDDEDEDEDVEQRIPKGRLNQVLRQRDEERERVKWLEEQLEVLIKGKQAPEDEEEEEEVEEQPEYNFDDAEEKYLELILEGEVKQAAALRKEINNARDELYQYQINTVRRAAKEDAVTETSNSLDEARFNTLLTNYTEEYDFLDDTSDAYNEKAVILANKLIASYMAEGNSKSYALKAAVEDVVPLFEKKKEEPKPKTTDRVKTARKKAARASKAQPPSSKSTNRPTRSLKAADIGKMTERQYDQLTAKEKAKLRGDIL